MFKDDVDARRVFSGRDMDGLLCGKSPHVRNKPFSAWPWPPEYKAHICLQQCSETSNIENDLMTFKMDSKELGNWCIPTITKKQIISNFTLDIKLLGELEFALGDLMVSQWMIYVSLPWVLIFSMIFYSIALNSGKYVVMLFTFLTLLASVLLFYALQTAANDQSSAGFFIDGEKTSKLGLQVCSWLVLPSAIGLIALVLCKRHRLVRGGSLLKEIWKVISDIPTLLLVPIPFVFVSVPILGMWIAHAMILRTGGNMVAVTTPQVLRYTYDPIHYPHGLNNSNPKVWKQLQAASGYELLFLLDGLCFFWNALFLKYFALMVVAGATGEWYFARKRPYYHTQQSGYKLKGYQTSELSPRPVFYSFCRVIRHHLGSISLGSFVSVFTTIPRLILCYVQKSTMNYMADVSGCCMICAQGYLMTSNDQAFIWVSIWGHNLYNSQLGLITILMRNYVHVEALENVGFDLYLLWLGKLIGSFMTTAIISIIIYHLYATQLFSLVVPCLVILLLTYLTTSLFIFVVNVATDTIFLCFLIDSDVHTDGSHFAFSSLSSLVEKEMVLNTKMDEEASPNLPRVRSYALNKL